LTQLYAALYHTINTDLEREGNLEKLIASGEANNEKTLYQMKAEASTSIANTFIDFWFFLESIEIT